MAKQPRLVVTDESDSGRNKQFRDTSTRQTMSRAETVKKIEKGNYPDYHVREINGVKTPVSNPDKSGKNNLG